MTRPDHRQLARITDPTIELLRGFPRRLEVQLERERRGGSAIPDGYPSGGLEGGGSSGIVICDEYGNSDVVTVTSVERTVFARMGKQREDEHKNLTTLCQEKLDQMRGLAGEIDQHLRAMEQAATVQNPADEDDWCKNHIDKAQLFEPVMQGSPYCAWCDGLNRQFGALPPKALVNRRAAGERLTEAMLDAAYGGLRQDAARKRTKGRAA